MTRQFEQYTAYAPIRTTTTATTWGGWQAIGMKCLGCKHHFLYGTASMCACASRTLVRTEHGDECASYCPRGAAMISAIDKHSCDMGIDFRAGECPDYGSMDCPKTVPGAECGVDMQYAQELIESKYRYYARRAKR